MSVKVILIRSLDVLRSEFTSVNNLLKIDIIVLITSLVRTAVDES